MAALLHPDYTITTKSQLRGAPPIDYQLRNRQRIKEMQKQHQRELQINKEKEIHNQILAQKKSNRFKSIPSRVHTADAKGTRRRDLHICGGNCKESDRIQSMGRIDDVKVDRVISPLKEGAIAKGRGIDEFVQCDADGKGSLEFKPHVSKTFGKIPAYLVRRRLEWAREENERKKNQKDPECPPGMIRLEEAERLRTLQLLRNDILSSNAIATYQKKMNLLPLRLETMGQKQRKIDLEQKLQEIENAIGVFDQNKVFVTKEMMQKYKEKAQSNSSNDKAAQVDSSHNGRLDAPNANDAQAKARKFDSTSHTKRIAGVAA
ncbi:hypothetical protein ABG067_007380 [Albugo candida]